MLCETTATSLQNNLIAWRCCGLNIVTHILLLLSHSRRRRTESETNSSVAAAAHNEVPPRTATNTHTVRRRVVFASTHQVTVKMADAPPPYPCFYLFTLTRLASESDPPLLPSHPHKSPTDPSPHHHSPPCQRVLLSRVRACVCVCACVSVRESCRACVCGACVCVSSYVH